MTLNTVELTDEFSSELIIDAAEIAYFSNPESGPHRANSVLFLRSGVAIPLKTQFVVAVERWRSACDETKQEASK